MPYASLKLRVTGVHGVSGVNRRESGSHELTDLVSVSLRIHVCNDSYAPFGANLP